MVFMQVLVGHTPESTDADAARLSAAARITTTIENTVSTRTINLRRRPIAGGRDRVPIVSTDIAWVLEL